MSSAPETPASSSQKVTLPKIPELFDPNYLDVLLPITKEDASGKATKASSATSAPYNPMMAALAAFDGALPLPTGKGNKTKTTNNAKAYKSTLSGTLDAFTGIEQGTYSAAMHKYLFRSWKESPELTLRIIWNLRSIHDGKGEKEAFYR